MHCDTILVLDIGTSGIKAAIYSEAGLLLAEAITGYQTMSPQPGYFEQKPDDWFDATRIAISEVKDTYRIALIALTGTMQNVILLGANGQTIFPALLYSDSRAKSRFKSFGQRMESLNAATRVGNQVDSLMCSAKLEWLRSEIPHIFADIMMIHTGAKDYVGYRLTGHHATDPTSASTTGLMNLESRTWDAEILADLAIQPYKLPAIAPSQAIIGTLSTETASILGLRAGIPVLNGIGDAGAATIGAGVEEPHQAYLYLGTTGWVARLVKAEFPRIPQSIYTLAHVNPNLLIEIAPILSAGDAVTWLQEICSDFTTTAQEEGDTIPAPLYLPYLKGERSPFHDPHVRGAFLGLDRSHGPNELYRAVLEGISLAIRHNIEALGGLGGQLTVLGGGVSNLTWMKTLANLTGKKIALHPSPVSATAYGVGILGARTIGIDFKAPIPSVILSPSPGSFDRSAQLFNRYLAASDFAKAWAEL
jgi:xylulokinase